jgi:hypothetical protein
MTTLLVTSGGARMVGAVGLAGVPLCPGGIQRFVDDLAVRRPAGSVLVHASAFRDLGPVGRFLFGWSPAVAGRMARGRGEW